jgi:hypothetical protein
MAFERSDAAIHPDLSTDRPCPLKQRVIEPHAFDNTAYGHPVRYRDRLCQKMFAVNEHRGVVDTVAVSDRMLTGKAEGLQLLDRNGTDEITTHLIAWEGPLIDKNDP